jgi:hypothetical protein
VMHDWWIALIASCFGVIVPLGTPTLLYRQHGRNTMGAERAWQGVGELLRRTLRAFDNTRLREDILRTAQQAEALLVRYRERLSPADRRRIERYAEIPRCGPLRRRLRVLELRTLAEHGLVRNIGTVLRA